MSTHFDSVSLQSWDHLFEAPAPYLHGPEVRELYYKMELLIASDNGSSNGKLRSKANFFQNSLIGPEYSSTKIENSRIPSRITIGCLEKADMRRRVVPFPDSIQELLDIGVDKFGISLTKTN
ncbi:hypothetical protein H5410_045135 [Solanum commersonii]|uniref:Uncharacterized protein n=1 Tax=Solanum commersonii TaxID=4109 RepID=A0A9J5XAU3_SOLCO|nr:hypothetical protein H5410_045135 [Solanum commersonii]